MNERVDIRAALSRAFSSIHPPNRLGHGVELAVRLRQAVTCLRSDFKWQRCLGPHPATSPFPLCWALSLRRWLQRNASANFFFKLYSFIFLKNTLLKLLKMAFGDDVFKFFLLVLSGI